MRHWVEVEMPSPGASTTTGTVGLVFHETWKEDGVVMPAEVHYCDCAGAGRHTHNPQTTDRTVEEWKAQHAHARCAHRRQIFVDVTNLDMDWRPQGEHRQAFDNGLLRYDQAVNGFSIAQKV